MNFDLLKELQDLKSSNKLIIVEGQKDKSALLAVGITKVETLNSPLFKFCEKVAKEHSDVVILTDLDKEGKKLYSKLKDNFSRCGIRIDDDFRIRLFRHTKLRQVEGLLSYLEKNT